MQTILPSQFQYVLKIIGVPTAFSAFENSILIEFWYIFHRFYFKEATMADFPSDVDPDDSVLISHRRPFWFVPKSHGSQTTIIFDSNDNFLWNARTEMKEASIANQTWELEQWFELQLIVLPDCASTKNQLSTEKVRITLGRLHSMTPWQKNVTSWVAAWADSSAIVCLG